jgi:hypothetical protein
MSKNGDNNLLVRDGKYIKYDRLLDKAGVEGRIDGPCKCLTCGMRYMSRVEADDCCDLAEEPGGVPASGPIMGSGSSRVTKKKVGVAPKTKPFMVSLEALDTQFTLDNNMLAVIGSIDLSELLPGETFQRNPETDRELFIILLSVLLDRADGYLATAYKIARASGMELYQLQWGKVTKQLKELRVLIPMVLDQEDPEDEDLDDNLVEEPSGDSEEELPDGDPKQGDWESEIPDEETEDEGDLEE